MIYLDEKRTVEGTWNRGHGWKATRHIRMYAENGLDDLQRFLSETPRKWEIETSKDNPAERTWDLNAGWDGAIKLAKEGWQEGADNLDARLQAIIPAAGRTARYGYAESGTSVNIGRYLTGHPKDMRSRKRRTMGSAPILHIVVNGNASCMVTATQMANYGTALVGLVDRLENTGKRVHLDVMYVLNERGARVACGWNVKRASEHVDLSAVAFSIAHPAAFRRLGFALIEHCPREFQNSGYGYCADIQVADLVDDVQDAMLVDGVNHSPSRCNSEKDALRFAIEQLNKAAVLAGHTTPEEPLIDEDEALFTL